MVIMKNDWDDLMKMVDKNEIDKIVEIYKEMEEKEYEYFIDKLIYEIGTTENCGHRNTIAIVLGDLGCNKAINTMIEVINMPKNRKCIGSLIYALESLDCENEVKSILHVLFDGNYEAKYNTYCLFIEKFHKMKEEDKEECKKLIEKEKEKIEETLDLIEKIEENIFS